MDKLTFEEARRIWTEMARHKSCAAFHDEAALCKKLADVFQVGDYYYMIFNLPETKIEYTSESIEKVLGYKPEDMTLDHLLSIIHREDLPYFMDFEATVRKFCEQLPPGKVMKYKTRYDYRIRKADGSYLRVLQQIVVIHSDPDGAVLRSFVLHTDISHLKTSTKMSLSLVGLDGEPSYHDLDPVKQFIPSPEIVLTRREKEVLRLMTQGKTTADIAEGLYISPATVSTHRKNIHRKTQTGSLAELISVAIEKNWIMVALWIMLA